MASLRTALLQSEVETADSRRFISQRSLDHILTEDAIKNVAFAGREFQKRFYIQPELTQGILKGGRKLLGTLILIQRGDAILKFLETGRLQNLDSILPFKRGDELGAILGNKSDAAKFYDAQWKFLAPIMKKDRSHRVFDEKTILPFIKCEYLTEGGFGSISTVMLCPSHQQLVNLDLNGNAVVIRKTIKEPRSAAKEEERILASLRALKHPNIIILLASYSYGSVHHLLFPPADGDLDALLQGRLQCPPNLRHEHTMLQETRGLSSAIETVHNFFVKQYDLNMIGCHYDLKPKNILVKGNRFLLTDFGLSRLEFPDSGTFQAKIPVQGYYYAPECQSVSNGFQKSKAGREADVWSFGCILAMLAVFIHSSDAGVKSFEQSRSAKCDIPGGGNFITKSFHVNGQLNPAVPEFLSKITRESTSAYLGRTVELVKRQLNIDPKARPIMSAVTEELFFIAQESVFRYSCTKFAQLQKKIAAQSRNNLVDLEMESKRYRIWGDTVGLMGEYRKRQHETQLQGFSSPIVSTLAEINDELHFIESWSERSLDPTYFRLKALNDKLWTYLPAHLVDEMTRSLYSTMLDGKTTEELQNISVAFQSEESSQCKSIGALAGFKQLMVEAENDPDECDNFRLQCSDVSIGCKFEFHSLGTYKRVADAGNQAILIEWTTYGRHWDQRMHSRIPKIARLFSNPTMVECSRLRVLPCRGYFKNDKRYGLIYEIPTLNPKPKTLRELIKERHERRSRPELGELFELARQIVHCVLEVHKVGWVHKSISSYNIIFLRATAQQPISVTSPYLIGFSHSRGDNPQTFTDGLNDNQRLYHHPDYQRDGHGFRPEHDFYSVGLVLLEIGMWRPLSRITQRMNQLTLEQRAAKLVKECEDNLGYTMGARYRDAVSSCLTTDFTTDRNRDEIRNEFESKVVNRLAKCLA